MSKERVDLFVKVKIKYLLKNKFFILYETIPKFVIMGREMFFFF